MNDNVTTDGPAQDGERGRVIAFPARFDSTGTAWEPWVNERTVARHFNASVRTIRRWRTRGMPSRSFEGLRRYRLSECEAWLERERGAA